MLIWYAEAAFAQPKSAALEPLASRPSSLCPPSPKPPSIKQSANLEPLHQKNIIQTTSSHQPANVSNLDSPLTSSAPEASLVAERNCVTPTDESTRTSQTISQVRKDSPDSNAMFTAKTPNLFLNVRSRRKW
jgi:hypothetical protein